MGPCMLAEIFFRLSLFGRSGGKADQMSHSVLQNWRSGTHLANSLWKCGNTVWVHPGLGKGHAKEEGQSGKPV